MKNVMNDDSEDQCYTFCIECIIQFDTLWRVFICLITVVMLEIATFCYTLKNAINFDV